MRPVARLTVLLAVLTVAQLAAMAGGGGGYSGGGGGGLGGGGGGLGGGGGGGGEGDILVLLLWLAFEYPLLGIPLLIVGGWFFWQVKRDRQEQHGARVIQRGQQARDQQQEGPCIAQLRQRDPAFDPERFKRRVRDAFRRAQQAWCAHDLDRIRPCCSDGVLERWSLQLQEQQAHGYRDRVEQLRIAEVHLVDVSQGAFFQVVTVAISGSVVDYRVDAQGRYHSGRRSPQPFKEYWSFIRRGDARSTGDGPGLLEGNCPNCGAGVIGSQHAACQHCGSLLTSGVHDWVLAEITQPCEWQAVDEAQIPGLAELRRRDPECTPQHLEDLASVALYRQLACERAGSTAPLAGFAAPGFVARVAQEQSTTARSYLAEGAIGAVVCRGFVPGAEADRAIVEVRWSAVTWHRHDDGSPRRGQPTPPRRHLYVLQRAAGVRSRADRALSSAHCPSCGAPEEPGSGGSCPYCGCQRNDGSSEWRVVDRFGWADPQVQELLRQAQGRTPSAGGAAPAAAEPLAAPAAAAAIERPVELLAWAVAVAEADGRIDGQEQEALERLAGKLGAPRDCIAGFRGRSEPAPTPRDAAEAESWLETLIDIAWSDGVVDATERQSLAKLGRAVGWHPYEVNKRIRQGRSRAMRQARAALRTLALLCCCLGWLAAATAGYFAPLPADAYQGRPGLVAVGELLPDGWGAAGGLQPGDAILAVAGAPVAHPAEVRYRLQLADPAEHVVTLLVRRAGALERCRLPHPLSLAAHRRWLPLHHLPERLQPLWQALELTTAAEREAAGRLPARLQADLLALHERGDLALIDPWWPTCWDWWQQRLAGRLPAASSVPATGNAFIDRFLAGLTKAGWPSGEDAAPPPDPAAALFARVWRGEAPPVIPVDVLGDNQLTRLLNARFQQTHASLAERARVAGGWAREREGLASVDHFLNQVRAALVDPFQHSAWPHRSSHVWQPERRVATRDRLLERLAVAEATDASLLLVALVAPLAADGFGDQVQVLLEQLRGDAPLLARLARQLGLASARAWEQAAVVTALSAEAGTADPLLLWLQERQLLPQGFWPPGILARDAVLARADWLQQGLQPDGLVRLRLQSQVADMMTSYNNMAWDFATDARLVDAAEAERHLTVMLRRAAYDMPLFMRDTVAALYARCGRFDQAVWWQGACVAEVADRPVNPQQQTELADYRRRLQRYQAGEGAIEHEAVEADELQETHFANGQLRTRFHSRGGQPNGRWESWYADGTVAERGWMKDGQRIGYWEHHWPDGTRQSAGCYYRGKRVGPWRTYDAAGRLFSQGSYLWAPLAAAARIGAWTWHDAAGEPLITGWYSRDQPYGPWRRRQDDGSWQDIPANDLALPRLDEQGRRQAP